jgi:pimeloyl-ACP methyl ester carboxylesterase
MRAALASLAVIACAAVAGCGEKEEPAPPPVAAAITADPEGPARATMIMVHGGGWVGRSAVGQQLLMRSPGALLRRRGWRVVSIDYEAGTDGLRDVLDTVQAEVDRKTSDGPLCLYGESSGGHLALVAAAQRGKEIDCVVGLGTPADLRLYEATARSRDQRIVDAQMRKYFGTTPAELAPWDPVSLAPSIDADVLLMREGDDNIVAADQSTRFAAAHPATQVVTLDAGDPADASTHFVHGTLSAKGRAAYNAAIAAFADRARRREAR